MAFGLPSILSDSLAVSLVSVLISALLSSESKPSLESLRSVVWATILLASEICAVGVATMPVQAEIFAAGFSGDDKALLIDAGRICWGMFLLVVLSLPPRAVMSVQNRIWPGAASQIMQSSAFVLGLVIIYNITGEKSVYTIAYSAFFSGFAVFAIHVVAVGRQERLRSLRALRAGASFRQLGPLPLGLLIVFVAQILWNSGRILDRSVTSTMGGGTLTALEYSYAVIMALAAVVGTSANLHLAPRIARAYRAQGTVPRAYWKAIAAITLSATFLGLALALGARLLVALSYRRGAFGVDETTLTTGILKLHALGLGPLVLALILTQVIILIGLRCWLIPIATIKFIVKGLALYGLLWVGAGLTAPQHA